MDKNSIQPLSPQDQAELIRRGSPYRRPVVALGLVLAISIFFALLPAGQRRGIFFAGVRARRVSAAPLLFSPCPVFLLGGPSKKKKTTGGAARLSRRRATTA